MIIAAVDERGPAPRTDDPVSAPRVIRLAVLGPVSVGVADEATVPRSRRQRRLLSILAVAAAQDKAVTVEEMVDALYGADTSHRARHSLATELWRSRQLLGASAILTDASGYRLDLAHCELDIAVFESLLGAGRTRLRSGDFAAAEADFAAALSLWRGEPLTDWCDHPEGAAAAGRLVELRLGGQEDHAEALAGAGRPAEATELLHSITATATTREHSWALLVECYLVCGDVRGARSAFDAARRKLGEYGLEVGSELRAVQARLESRPGEVADTAPSPGGIEPESKRAAAQLVCPALIGRDDEVRALLGAAQDALQLGRPAAIVVSGEPGVGKTALVEHAVAVIGRSSDPAPTIAWVHCDRRLNLPFAPLMPLLAELVARTEAPLPVLLAQLDPGSDEATAAPTTHTPAASGQQALLDAVADLIETAAADAGGMVLVVHDVHWATEAVIETLLHLLARRRSVPLCLIVTVRDPIVVTEPLDAVLAELRRRAVRTLALPGLDEESAGQLLGPGASPDQVRAAHRRSGGNPLYLTRLAAVAPGSGERSGSLRDAIAEHLDSLSPEVRHVLRLAAVAGDRFDRRIVTAAAARAPSSLSAAAVTDALDAAARAGMVHSRSDEPYTTQFVHVLVQEHLYADLPGDQRRMAHVLVAEASERLIGASPVSVDLIAHHYAAGWPHSTTEVTAARLARAGDHAAAQLDFDAAARYFRRASDLMGMDQTYSDPDRQAWLLEAEGSALVALAGLRGDSGSGEDLDRARVLFTALGTVAKPGAATQKLRACVGVARTYSIQPVDESVLNEIAVGIAAVIDSGDPGAETSRSELIGEGLTQLRTYRPSRAADLLDRAVIADPGSSGRLRAAAWAQESVSHRLTSSRQLVQDPTADPVAAWIRLWVSEVAASRRAIDDPPPGKPENGVGEDRSWWEVRAWETTAAIAGGRFARAERLLGVASKRVAAARTASDIATRWSAIAGQRIRLQLLRTPEGIISSADAPSNVWITSHPAISHPVIRSWAAHLAAAVGRVDLATAACDDLIEQYHDGLVNDADLLPWACGTAAAALAAGHRRAAILLQEVLRPHSGHFAIHTFTAYWGSVDHHLGRLAMLLGESEEAVERLDMAVVQYRHANARPYQARALNDLAAAHWRTGGAARADAQTRRRESVALFEDIGIDATSAAHWPPQT